MIARCFLALAALIFCCAAPAIDAQTPRHLPLSANDQRDVQRIERWLNNDMRSLKADFLQISDQGAVTQGTFYLQRPGKMRFSYEPPSPILMVADGSFLIYHDKTLQQTSYIPLSSSPVGFLVRDRIALSGDLTITHFERGAGSLRVSLRQSQEWDQGELTLVFSDNPLFLQQWTVLDAQKHLTRVSLSNIQLGVKNDSSLFYFTPPDQPTNSGGH